jgi:environmental stress-induced protein Ves
MQLIPIHHQKVSNWSGGTTTELYIYPLYADVKNQDFEFRISTAKVLTENSVFTFFPGFHRRLAILEGKLKMQFDDAEPVVLGEYEQVYFQGDWSTSAEGIVTDFNVIYSDEWEAEVEILAVDEDMEIDFIADKQFIYCFKGAIIVNETLVNEGEFVELERLEKLKVFEAKTQIVWVKMFKL